MRPPSSSPIDLVIDRSGTLLYRVRLRPDALPPVRTGDLEQAWDNARSAAAASVWGDRRAFRFQSGDDPPLDLVLNDDDAACWAEAVDARWSLQTPYGLSLCLRLLGLVAVLSRSRSLRALCPLSRAGARPDPALLRAAATVPLSARGQLDVSRLEAHVAPALSSIRSGAEC